MDKKELIDRLNAAIEAVRSRQPTGAKRMLREIIKDVERGDILTTLTLEGEPAHQMRGVLDTTPVDHFAEWVEGTDLRYGRASKDFSVENPKLHELYTNWAHHHLLVINKAIRRLGRFNHLGVSDTIVALNKCRRELIVSDTAYRDAAARIVAGIEPDPYTPEPQPYVETESFTDGSNGEPVSKLDTIRGIIEDIPQPVREMEDYREAIKAIKELF